MTDRLFLLVGTLSSKAFALAVTGTSLTISAIFAELVTGQLSIAGLAGVFGTALAAICLVIPRVMEQRRKSRESDAQLKTDSIALLVKAHDRDVAFYKEKIAAFELIIALHVKSKHNAVGEWAAALNAYRILAGQLRSLGQKPEIELAFKSYLEIVGEADQKIESIASSRVAEPPPSPPLL